MVNVNTNPNDPLQLLILCKFGNQLIDNFLNTCVLPIAESYGTVRLLTAASNDPDESRYWVSVVQRLIFASDVLIIITTDMGSNVKWIEDNYVFKSAYLLSPFDSVFTDLGMAKKDILKLCRPGVFRLTLTKRIVRKGKSKISYWGRVKSAELDVSMPAAELNATISDLIERVKRHRESYLNQFSKRPILATKYADIRRAILSDPEVSNSVSHYAEQELNAPSLNAISQYCSITTALHQSKIYVLWSSILLIMRKLDNCRLCNLSDLRRFKLAMSTVSKAVFEGDVNKERIVNLFTVLMIIVFHIAWIIRLAIRPIQLVYSLRKRI